MLSCTGNKKQWQFLFRFLSFLPSSWSSEQVKKFSKPTWLLFFFFLASGGGLSVSPKIYSIAQWSCSTSLSLWKIPDSNPGPLQSGALPISHHIFEEQKWCMFLVALSQMFDCRKPLDDLHDDTHEMGRLQILSTQVQIYQGRRLMEASLNCWTCSHIIISSKW